MTNRFGAMNKPADEFFPYSSEEGQKLIDEYFEKLPVEIEQFKNELNELIPQFESIQLIANICHHNHIRDMDKPYTDYNEGRMAVLPELISMWALRGDYQAKCWIGRHEFKEQVLKVNDIAGNYLGRNDALTMRSTMYLPGDEKTIDTIAKKLNRDETWVRNPGLPDHHFEFSAELFKPLETEIKKKFGFTIADSLHIRKNIVSFINKKLSARLAEANEKAEALKNEVVKFRNTGFMDLESILTSSQFHQLKVYSTKKLRIIFINHFREELLYDLAQIYGLKVPELASFLKLDEEVIQNFLDCLSCSFNTPIPDANLIGNDTILRTKPIVKHGDTYIIPSFALLAWGVEPVIEEYFKTSNALANKFKDIKHNFLLRTGIDFLKQMMPNATFYPENLFYELDFGEQCETDALIAYNNTLFIVEAKGHRLTKKAKSGNAQRTDTHLNDMIGDAAVQGKRTADFIKNKPQAEFKTKKGERFILDRERFDDYITIGLTLEPIGNLTPLMKVANDLNYFSETEFPWIVSLYDLIIFAEHLEIPIQFLHFLKRRKRFLEIQNMYVFEEMDLLGYYLSGGLYIEHTIERARDEHIHTTAFDNHTDEFNDYYMFKYGHTDRPVEKLTSYLTIEFKSILKSLERSDETHKVTIMMMLLDVNEDSMNKLTAYIKKIKKQSLTDDEVHDCTIGTTNPTGNKGITFMVGPDKTSVQNQLNKYCPYKILQQNAVQWIGIGDVTKNLDQFDIQCSFYYKEGN